MEHKHIDTCCDTDAVAPHWYQNKTLWVAAVLAGLCALSFGVPFLVPFRESLWMYVRQIWWAILLGLTLGGIMEHYVPRQYISVILSQQKKRTIFKAIGLGFFMSICSHGILALAIQLYKKGASIAAVIAFLLASPWANLPLTLMLIGFFGVARAIFIVVAAIVIAIVTGLLFQVLAARGWIETNPNSTKVDASFSIRGDIDRRRKAYTFSGPQLVKDVKGVGLGIRSLSNMVLWWILIGMGLASLAGAYVPQEIFRDYMGPTVNGMLVTLGVATVLEVCSEGTAPLAFEIFKQTGAFGNSLVFLMAGVATDYTEIGLLWHNVGRRTALWLPLLTVPQVIAWGALANWLFGGG